MHDLTSFASALSESTLKAYLNADYKVLSKPPFSFKIGQLCTNLPQLLHEHHAICAAFITAFNPYGQLHTIEQNHEADDRLRAMIHAHQLSYCEGFGSDPDGQWEEEKSYLIINLALEPSKELARRFQQNALVWIDTEAIPQLVLLESPQNSKKIVR